MKVNEVGEFEFEMQDSIGKLTIKPEHILTLVWGVSYAILSTKNHSTIYVQANRIEVARVLRVLAGNLEQDEIDATRPESLHVS